MPRRLSALALAFLCAILCVTASSSSPRASASAGDEVPAWLRQAAAVSVPAYDRKVSAVVLVDDETVTVGTDGRIRTVTNYAVRVLTREGRDEAAARISYRTGSDKVKEFRAWLIRPNGEPVKYGKDETADVADIDNDIYNEYRARVIIAGRDAEPGTVFGYQATTEERSPVSQLSRSFQRADLPVLLSRYALTLPAGWRSTSLVFNHPKVEPAVSGTTYTWELRNLPPIEPEPSGPTVYNLVPRLAVNYGPEAGTSTPGSGRVFNNWADLSRWLTELHDPRAEPDDRIAVKARELTANAKTEFEKIQAVGRYAQNIQYISVQVGIGSLQPHAATEVFAKSYGDCKDKVTLMRAMLRALRMPSYSVAIYSGDPTFVREEWPGFQFNHAIIAVRVGDETKAPSVMQHPTLGRLLFFDPTDPHVPVGDLPQHEQGSFALVAAGDGGSLVRIPVTPPEANISERLVEVELSPEGQIKAVAKERSTGAPAVHERGLFRQLPRTEYDKAIERWIGRGAPGAQIAKVEPSDAHLDGRFNLDVEFTVPNFAQVMQGRLIVFKPAFMPPPERFFLTEEKRRHPVVLQPAAYKETVRVKLPAGFDVDEVPDATKLDTPFGSYATSYEVKDGHLLFTRAFKQTAVTMPADQYKTIQDFYARIRAAEQSPVVLARK